MTMPKYDLSDKVAIITKRSYSCIVIEWGIVTAIKITKDNIGYDVRTSDNEYRSVIEAIVFPLSDVAKEANKLIGR